MTFSILGSEQFEAYGQTRSTDAVRSEIGDFFKVYLGRSLSADELKRVTREFLALFDNANTCESRCVSALARDKTNLVTLKNKRGQPEDLIVRHFYIAASYFSPKQRGTLIQQLLAEPDPVRASNPKNKRLMTEKDVVSLANIGFFVNSNEPPKHRTFPREEIDEASAMLDQIVGSGVNAREMPLYFSLAAELWAGIQREWPTLSARERQSVRDYIQLKSSQSLPLPLYRRLLGLSDVDARQLQASERLERWSAKMSNMVSNYIRVTGRVQTTNTLIQEIHRVTTPLP
jgi:hypothetical protein